MGCKYVAVVELKNADANGVIASINTGMVGFSNFPSQIQTVAFGSDGASVYVGRLNGVVAKLRVEIPWLLGVHCIAHRLELSVLDALKDEEQLNNVQEMLQGLYKHYHYSPKALRELKELAQVLDEKINKPVNLRGTRWLPHCHDEEFQCYLCSLGKHNLRKHKQCRNEGQSNKDIKCVKQF